MRNRCLRLGAAATAVALAAAFAAAAETEAPRLYTNADIERLFGPPKPSTAPAPTPAQDAQSAARDAQDRAFLSSFLDREYRQIADEQERAARQRGIDEASRYAPSESYELPWAYGLGWYGNGAWGRVPPRGGGPSGRMSPYSPYAPKPGQPGWNERVIQEHRAITSGATGHGGGAHPAPHATGGHGTPRGGGGRR